MIKQKLVLRNEVYQIYSSEQQERMKVYFQLNEQFIQCKDVCITVPDNDECLKKCDLIFNDYANLLKDRYQGENKELLDKVVKDLPSFDRSRRKDRGWFYSIFGKNFNEMNGQPDIRQQTNQ